MKGCWTGNVLAKNHFGVGFERVLPTGFATFASRFFCLWTSITLLTIASCRADEAQPRLPTARITVAGLPLEVELAVTGEQRYLGLSHRTFLEENSGMLFVYEEERPLTFTMRDTLIPLSIAFISAELEVIDIQKMDVGPGQLFDSAAPAQYALEVNQGWFEHHGIEVGARVVLP